MAIKNLPFKFIGNLEYESYKDVEERIFKFDKVRNIGKDESGQFDMYCIELGNRKKPTILITAGMHGTEWQGTQYSLNFMEQLRDGKFPDKIFRNKLLTKFNIAYIPVINPYGYDRTDLHARIKGRYNVNEADLNRDFNKFEQAESRNVKAVMDELKPFTYLDCHMMAPKKDGSLAYRHMMFGNGQYSTTHIRDHIADMMEFHMDRKIDRWQPYANMQMGLSRRYMRDSKNPHTPYTLAYITEFYRPVDDGDGQLKSPLSYEEIHRFGMTSIYLFLTTSTEYYRSRKQSF